MAAIRLWECKRKEIQLKRFKWAVFSAAFALAVSAAFAATTASVQPIVDAQTGYLIGGSINDNWISATETAKTLKGGETYRVYGSMSPAGKTTGSKTRTNEAPCDETNWIRLRKNFNGVLALGGNWDAIRQKPRAQNLNQKFYLAEVARILKAHRIKNPKVVITQLWRVDLDGDKVGEVILSASHYAGEKAAPQNVSPNTAAGEYSLVLLRKVVKGKVKTFMLAEEYHTRAETFSAPSVHRIAGLYDLNGDGKMEIVLSSRYYEGGWTSVIEVKPNAVKEVLSAGCGA